jgi:hypothetical protein
LDILKALTTLNTGAYLIKEAVDEGIRDYIGKEPVLLNAVNKVPWATNTYFIRKRTAAPTATWKPDFGDLPAAQQSTYAKVSKSVKYVYARGEVSGPEIEAAGALYNALAIEIEAQSRALAMELSTKIATATGSNDEIEGIIHQIDTNTDMNAGGGAVTKSGTLALAMIDEAIDVARGEVDMLVTSRAVRRKVNSLLQAQQQFVDRVEVQAGFRVLAYDGLPIVTDLNWETNTDILMVRRADAKLLVHKDWTYEDLAKVKDSVDFYIKGYFGFALEGRPVHLKGFTL